MLTFTSILLAMVIAFFVTVAIAMTHQHIAKAAQLRKIKNREERLHRSALWKKEAEIKYAAVLWGIDNETDVDITKLLILTAKVKEGIGEEVINRTVETVLSTRHSTVAAAKQLSRRTSQVIRTLDLAILNTVSLIERVLKNTHIKGDMGNDEPINL